MTQPFLIKADLQEIFHSKIKRKDQVLLGAEVEWLGFSRKTGKPACYEGKEGVEALLQHLLSLFQAEPLSEHGRLLGLKGKDFVLTLEPGAQIEISTRPTLFVEEQARIIQRAFQRIQEEASKFNLVFLPISLQPFCGPQEIGWIPKARYAIMAPFLRARGRLAHWMMKATAGLQICIDFCNQGDARKKFVLAQSLAPYLTALSASSFLLFRQKSTYHHYRGKIWWHTDPSRTRFVRNAHNREDLFQAYTEYALSVPLMFLRRENQWYTPPPLTFARYLEKGWGSFSPAQEDWVLHLNGLFPPVRLREYIEIRYFDVQPLFLNMGILALVKGIFYSSQLDAALEAFFLPFRALVQLYKKVWQQGIEACWKGYRVREGLTKLFQMADQGLKELLALGLSSSEEQNYLETLRAHFQEHGSLREKMQKELPGRISLQDLIFFYEKIEHARALPV